MDDLGLGGKGICLTGDAIIEPNTDTDEEITETRGHVRPVRAMHADHAHPQGVGAWKTAKPH